MRSTVSSLLLGTVSYCKHSTGNSKGQPLIDDNKTPEDSNGKKWTNRGTWDMCEMMSQQS